MCIADHSGIISPSQTETNLPGSLVDSGYDDAVEVSPFPKWVLISLSRVTAPRLHQKIKAALNLLWGCLGSPACTLPTIPKHTEALFKHYSANISFSTTYKRCTNPCGRAGEARKDRHSFAPAQLQPLTLQCHRVRIPPNEPASTSAPGFACNPGKSSQVVS